ncbi:MAG: benzoyl-CoA reductase, bzd-type, subunit Q [Deltaproteobacteria bacterium]|nr:benzoyl-CoA reductase, bzd-type, subunit Q [Deltaproteobacteria bacterium]
MILVDGEIASHSIVRTGPESAETAVEALEEALKRTTVCGKSIELTVATGYGRIVVPFADKNITEISCHAKGAHFFTPTVRTILDMGGQDCKAIRCDGSGKVTTFLMNDKCAAGTGRAMEVMAALLGIRLEDIGPLSLRASGEPVKVSNTCVVFAKSEILSLMRQGVPTSDILAGLCDGIADRVISLLRIVGVEEDLMITGGISKNLGVVKRIEQKLGVKAHICFEPQIVGALGAALFAGEILQKRRRGTPDASP